MIFRIGTLLDYNYNSAHADHVHVEPHTKERGTPPHRNPGMTSGIEAIYDALEYEFGPGEYFLDSSGRYVGDDPGVYWTHMGGYHRRYIGSGTTWSQHSWWNALDIGPYLYKEQDKFISFLKENTGKELEIMEPQFHEDDAAILKQVAQAIRGKDSNGFAVAMMIDEVRKGIVTVDELQKALNAISSGNADSYARRLAKEANERIDAIKEAI